MFSQTTEYAIRAMIEIAKLPPGKTVLARELGEALDLPPHYLAKILLQLARKRILKSTRGRSGGFQLAKNAKDISLRDVVDPFEDLAETKDCILGQRLCNDRVACPLHDFWKNVRERYIAELDDKTVADVAAFDRTRRQAILEGLELPRSAKRT